MGYKIQIHTERVNHSASQNIPLKCFDFGSPYIILTDNILCLTCGITLLNINMVPPLCRFCIKEPKRGVILRNLFSIVIHFVFMGFFICMLCSAWWEWLKDVCLFACVCVISELTLSNRIGDDLVRKPIYLWCFHNISIHFINPVHEIQGKVTCFIYLLELSVPWFPVAGQRKQTLCYNKTNINQISSFLYVVAILQFE